MRTTKLFYGLFAAALAIVGCSSEENLTTDNGQNTGSEESHYLYVNILGGDGTTKSRADANYEDGDENTVNNVRFYFFDKDGKAADVKKNGNGYVNFCEVTTATSADSLSTSTGISPNVEKLVNAVVVLNYASGDRRPAKMVAVLNYKSNDNKTKYATLDNKSKSLSELQAIIEDYSSNGAIINGTGDTQTKPFLMTSSVYAKSSTDGGDILVAADLADENLQQTSALAVNHPVDIYVERVVAKVRFDLTNSSLSEKTTDSNGNIYVKAQQKTGTSKSTIQTAKGDDLYIKLLGWNVTATTNNSYLFKKVQENGTENGDWDASKNWTDNPWTNPTYHRSYWAENPSSATVTLPTLATTSTSASNGGYGSFTSAEAHKFTSTDVAYVQENAGYLSTATDTTHTKVIIAAQLGTMSSSTFTATSIYEYADNRYIDSTACKTAMLNAFTPNLYKQIESNSTESGDITISSTKYKKISASDVELVSAIKAGKVTAYNVSGTQSYRSYLKLPGKDAPKYYSMSSSDGSSYTATEVSDVNKELNTVYANVYKDGYCYYYFDIQHFGYGVKGATFGNYGVVRNHLYACDLTAIYGLGTPVPDETEIIVPEKPTEDVYVAAKINILSWRIVNNKITLDW